MPRTTFVFPTSTTRRLDIENRLLRHHQVARADRQDFLAIAQHRATLVIDSDPRPAHGAVADYRSDAIAGFVNGERAPFLENRMAIEWPGETIVEMFDECFG